MKSIDLNCDLGEGGPHDDALLEIATSASIACGGHAGDEQSMRRAIRGALRERVVIGAHPGFADRQHFGRRELQLTKEGVSKLIAEQTLRLVAVARSEGAAVSYVKPHGALYNLAARDADAALAVIDGLHRLDFRPALFALSGSKLAAMAADAGIRVLHECFADRRYRADGSLVPRSETGSSIVDAEEAALQAVALASGRSIQTRDGSPLGLRCDTLCVHGDDDEALTILRRVRDALLAARATLASPFVPCRSAWQSGH